MRVLLSGVVVLALVCMVSVASEEVPKLPKGVFAEVGGEYITQAQYHAHYAQNMRREFYHGKVPEAELAKFNEIALQALIDRVLLRKAAEDAGLTVDQVALDQEIALWVAGFAGEVPEEIQQLERQKRYDESLAKQLRAEVEGEVSSADEAALRDFYQTNTEKFTRPEQLKVSLVLLNVAPYEQAPVWQAAYDKAELLLKQLEQESFAKIAQAHSQHESAQNGGDLGFVHAGMLSSEVQEIVNALQPGEVVAKPLVLLQGIALLKLEARRASVLLGFEQVKDRVVALYLKEKREQVWGGLLTRLRKENPVTLASQ